MSLLTSMRWQDVLDILIITYIIYRTLSLLRGTRAFQLVKGLIMLGILATVVRTMRLDTISWLLGRVLSLTLLALPIVFQPELRKILEEIGRGTLWRRQKAKARADSLADEVLKALTYLKRKKIGALVLLQRGTGLKDFTSTGVMLNADITSELLIGIFWDKNPLHDGAAILSTERVLAASCYLPLTEDTDLSRWLGTRHRAAIGVTEVSDAIALVVSEERGEVSMSVSGKLTRDLKDDRLKAVLSTYFSGGSSENKSWFENLQNEIRQLGQMGGGLEE